MSIGNSIENQLKWEIEHHEDQSEAKHLPHTRGDLILLLIPPTREQSIKQVAKLFWQVYREGEAEYEVEEECDASDYPLSLQTSLLSFQVFDLAEAVHHGDTLDDARDSHEGKGPPCANVEDGDHDLDGYHYNVKSEHILVRYLVKSKPLQFDLLIVLDDLFAQKIRNGLDLILLSVHKVRSLQKVLLRKHRHGIVLAMTILD